MGRNDISTLNGKINDWGTRSSFLPEGVEISFLGPLNEVKMPFPIEIRGFHLVLNKKYCENEKKHYRFGTNKKSTNLMGMYIVKSLLMILLSLTIKKEFLLLQRSLLWIKFIAVWR